MKKLTLITDDNTALIVVQALIGSPYKELNLTDVPDEPAKAGSTTQPNKPDSAETVRKKRHTHHRADGKSTYAVLADQTYEPGQTVSMKAIRRVLSDSGFKATTASATISFLKKAGFVSQEGTPRTRVVRIIKKLDPHFRPSKVH